VKGRVAAMILAVSAPAWAQEFTYNPAGQLVSGSGTGRVDEMVYVPDMRYPIEEAPSYANSQVWGRGGSQGPGGGQCDAENYSYPWWDNYCESRSWPMPLCPAGTGHQGQDIRPSTCDDDVHWTVATVDGQITNIGSYSVYLVADDGTQHRYLHSEPSSIQVAEGQRVTRGTRISRISNAFFDSNGNRVGTTIHLHFDLNQNIAGMGAVYVPTYMSLVRSYEALLGVEAMPCAIIPPEGGIVDDFGPCATFYGPAEFWRVVDGMGHDGRMHWTNAWVNDTPSNFARWKLELAEAGPYNVEVNVVPPYNVSRKARYLVRADGADTTIEVDQSAVDGWHSLGEFDFGAGGDQRVEIYDNTGESGDDLHITADAVRLTRVDGTTGPDAGTNRNNDTSPDAGANNGNQTTGPGQTAGDAGFSEDDIRTNRGCCASIGARPIPVSLFALFVLLAALRRRVTGSP